MATNPSTALSNALPDPTTMAAINSGGESAPGVLRVPEGLKLEKVTGKEDFRPILTYAWIYTVKGKDSTSTYLAATDSKVMARVPLAGSLLDKTEAPVPIAKEALKALEKQCRFDVTEAGDVKVGDVTYQRPLSGQGPPDFEALLNSALDAKGEWDGLTKGDKVELTFNARLMLNVVEGLGGSVGGEGKKHVVTVETPGQLKAMVVRVGQSDEMIGLVMPIRRSV